MRYSRTASLLVATGALTGALTWSLCLRVESGDLAVPFPEGYRNWVHVKTTLVGPQSPAFAVNGGIHHFYANEKALEGYRTGTFPDGAVLIDDLLETRENAGITSAGPRRRVAVMLKGAERYRETGGWGFEVFKSDGHDGSLTPEAAAGCFACHEKARASVFSEFQP